MLTTNDLKIAKVKKHLSEIVSRNLKDQSIKNKIHQYKKEGNYGDYLALKCAYEIYKINRENQ